VSPARGSNDWTGTQLYYDPEPDIATLRQMMAIGEREYASFRRSPVSTRRASSPKACAGWAKGDRVVLNGSCGGEDHWTSLALRARLNGHWLVPLPSNLSTRHAMAIGTTGYSATLFPAMPPTAALFSNVDGWSSNATSVRARNTRTLHRVSARTDQSAHNRDPSAKKKGSR
jgi:hypothetical protein